MLILIWSPTNAQTIARNLGRAEYSYYFVLREFRPLLEELGVVIEIADPEHDVDRIYTAAARRGLDCIFLCFAPPHLVPGHLACPTIPVFAWEFDTLPSETWSDNWREDWGALLRRVGRAITHSAFTVDVVRGALGASYPVANLPAPVWDNFAACYRPERDTVLTPPTVLDVRGRIIDTASFDLAPYTSAARALHGQAELPGSRRERALTSSVTLSGVIYTTVLNPNDGRKNFSDMIGAFTWALRDEPRATLVIKATNRKCEGALQAMVEEFAKAQPTRCRMVLIDGFLADEDYARLLDISTYAINTSHGEGQCLPLMEYMSAGKPAVTPAHTGMGDYVRAENAFVVRSTLEPCHWPQDPREAYRTRRHRIDFESLVQAYADSFRVATADAQTYRRMAQAAHHDLQAHCSRATILARLQQFLGGARQAAPRRDNAASTPQAPRTEVVRLLAGMDAAGKAEPARTTHAETGRGS